MIPLLVGALVFVAAPVVGFAYRAVVGKLAKPRQRVAASVAAALLVIVPRLFGGVIGLLDGAILLVLVALGSYGCIGHILGWAGRRALHELSAIGPMISRVLPVLMLTVLFCFFNAEIWQVVAGQSMPRTWAAVLVLWALSAALVITNAGDEVDRIGEMYPQPPDTPPLARRERVNIRISLVTITMIQVSLFRAVMFFFFVGFGVLSVSTETATQWIGHPPQPFGGILGGLPGNRPLVQVCLILAAFGGLSYAAGTGNDETYRRTFVEPVRRELGAALELRHAYRQRVG